MKPAPVGHASGRTSEVRVRGTVTPVLRGRTRRTVGLIVEDGEVARWQPTPDVEGLVRLGIVAAATVALPVGADCRAAQAGGPGRLALDGPGWLGELQGLCGATRPPTAAALVGPPAAGTASDLTKAARSLPECRQLLDRRRSLA